MKGIRVLLLFPHITMPGGALNYTTRLAAELQEAGATVGLVTLTTSHKLTSPFSGVEVLTLNGPLTSSLWYWLLFPYWQKQLENLITTWQPNILVPQVFPSNWWGWLYRRTHPETKLVWICHEPSAFIHSMTWIKALTPWWKSALARLLRPALVKLDISLSRFSDATIANSSFTADTMARVYGFSPDGIATPGVDIGSSIPIEASQECEIITVAHLTKFKRIDFLLDVFREFLKYYPKSHYTIVGAGEEAAALKSQSVRMGLQSQVTFFGTADSQTLASLYANSCLFLHGSVAEPFGMAPLEAIASGVPVAAHCSGGVTEFINERCGLLMDSEDPAEWSRQCATFIENHRSQAGFRKKVQECAIDYQWSRTLTPALEIIDKVSSIRNDFV